LHSIEAVSSAINAGGRQEAVQQGFNNFFKPHLFSEYNKDIIKCVDSGGYLSASASGIPDLTETGKLAASAAIGAMNMFRRWNASREQQPEQVPLEPQQKL